VLNYGSSMQKCLCGVCDTSGWSDPLPAMQGKFHSEKNVMPPLTGTLPRMSVGVFTPVFVGFYRGLEGSDRETMSRLAKERVRRKRWQRAIRKHTRRVVG